TAGWGFDQPGISNGAVYADLDNDGDLDIITSNMDEYAGVYRNNSREQQPGHHYIRLQLHGAPGNTSGIGTKIWIYTGADKIYLEQQPVRGYQSSVDMTLLAGLSGSTTIDSLRVVWPDDKTQLLPSVKADQTLSLDIRQAGGRYNYAGPSAAAYFSPVNNTVNYIHRENPENDFNRQYLLPQLYSHNGPCMAKGDVNGDGLEDLFIGGAKGHPGALFLQAKDGHFQPAAAAVIQADSLHEATGAVFFDADGDHDLDLYVVSGGYEYEENDPLLEDRLYLNDGKGHFTKAVNALPAGRGNKSCVRAADIDGDGDTDLFIGGSVVPGRWPAACASHIYINDGKGHFSDQTAHWAPVLDSIGMVTDAVWADVNNDHTPDLIIVGQWMSPVVLLNQHGALERSHPELRGFTGWWNTVLAVDYDKDGDTDFVLGNFGMNSCLQPTLEQPLRLYAADIDGNGSVDPVMTCYMQGKSYPFPFMDDMNNQVPSLKKLFKDYSVYANATIKDIIPPGKLPEPLETHLFQSIYLENTGGRFRIKSLPIEAQAAPVYAMTAADVNHDGHTDLILFGNNSGTRIRLARQDANHGTVLLGDGKGDFNYLPPAAHGINIRGDVRSSLFINNTLLVGVNNQQVRGYMLR
ncbi:MAG TPA: FG-GAP-like repeat-containing protein, partial [Chitinophagaceae bacterium]|nr:FG-GAP-like repeat-containing protein [Chitinophagaceae bacterium]